MQSSSRKIVVFGFDPGTVNIGYGVVSLQGQVPSCIAYGTISAGRSVERNLFKIQTETKKLLRAFSPTHLAIERVYFGKNSRSAMMVSEVRGATLSLAQEEGLEILDMSPQQVKNRICGYGRADKKAIARMTRMILSIPHEKTPPDATDALAIALAGVFEAHRKTRLGI